MIFYKSILRAWRDWYYNLIILIISSHNPFSKTSTEHDK
jgi:hypothetical protein